MTVTSDLIKKKQKKHSSRREWLLELAADKGNKGRDTESCYTVVLLSGLLEVTSVWLPAFTDL